MKLQLDQKHLVRINPVKHCVELPVLGNGNTTKRKVT